MTLKRKLILYLVFMLLSVSLSLCETVDKPVIVSFMHYELLIRPSFLFCFISSIFFVIGLLRSLFEFISKIFSRGENNILEISINDVINMLFSEYEPSSVQDSDPLFPIKLAILCHFEKNSFDEFLINKLKKYPILIANIRKRQIRNQIDNEKIEQAISLADDVLEKYSKHIDILADEMLDLKIASIRRDLVFNFDPSRYKYDLSSKFIAKYTSLSYLELAIIEDRQEKKISFLEKAFHADKSNLDIVKALVSEMIRKKTKDKDVTEIIKESFIHNPSRILAYILEELGKNDIFETAIEITSYVSNSNIEKMWLLCIIAESAGLNTKLFEIFAELVRVGEIDELVRFYVKHYSKFDQNADFLYILRERLEKRDKFKDQEIKH